MTTKQKTDRVKSKTKGRFIDFALCLLSIAFGVGLSSASLLAKQNPLPPVYVFVNAPSDGGIPNISITAPHQCSWWARVLRGSSCGPLTLTFPHGEFAKGYRLAVVGGNTLKLFVTSGDNASPADDYAVDLMSLDLIRSSDAGGAGDTVDSSFYVESGRFYNGVEVLAVSKRTIQEEFLSKRRVRVHRISITFIDPGSGESKTVESDRGIIDN